MTNEDLTFLLKLLIETEQRVQQVPLRMLSGSTTDCANWLDKLKTAQLLLEEGINRENK